MVSTFLSSNVAVLSVVTIATDDEFAQSANFLSKGSVRDDS